MPPSPTSSARRLYLRVTLKLLTLLGIGLFAWALLGTLGPEERDTASRRVSLEGVAPGTLERITHQGRPLLLLHLDAAEQASLQPNHPALLDPASRWSQQPDDLPLPARAYRPAWLLVEDRAGKLGCPLEKVAPGHPEAPVQPWPGGLREPCRGSWYDLAGRAYQGEHALRNLSVPPHNFADDTLLLE